jgi:hypothetical protein
LIRLITEYYCGISIGRLKYTKEKEFIVISNHIKNIYFYFRKWLVQQAFASFSRYNIIKLIFMYRKISFATLKSKMISFWCQCPTYIGEFYWQRTNNRSKICTKLCIKITIKNRKLNFFLKLVFDANTYCKKLNFFFEQFIQMSIV